MASFPLAPSLLDDLWYYSRQRARAIYGRKLAAAMMHLYGFRPQVLVAGHTFDNRRATTVPQSYTEIGTWYGNRAETTRALWFVTTVLTEAVADRFPMRSTLQLRVTVSDVDGTNPDGPDELDAVVVQGAPLEAEGIHAANDLRAIMRPTAAGLPGIGISRMAVDGTPAAKSKIVVEAKRAGGAAIKRLLSITILEEPLAHT